MIRPDSLIFDMDGTLWDNVGSYEIVWNKGLEILGYERRVNREDLLKLMGKEARVMLSFILPNSSIAEQDKLFDEVIYQYNQLIPNIKPEIYEGVYDGLEKLAEKYPLFLLSNCEEGGLVNFMSHTATNHLFVDYMEHGQNLKPKAFNMQLLKDKHNLKSPIYIGDTDTDSKASAEAGLPFVYMTYGFGESDNYSMKFDSFGELTEYFLNL